VRKRSLFAILSAGAIIAPPTFGLPGLEAHAAAPPSRILTGQTPNIVADGGASLRGRHDPHAALTLNIGLGVHEGAALDAIITAASDPTSPSYGHYLSNDQYMTRFAPTDAAVQAVRDWATGAGLAVGADGFPQPFAGTPRYQAYAPSETLRGALINRPLGMRAANRVARELGDVLW